MIHRACRALAPIFRPGIRYNRCGVMLTELTGVVSTFAFGFNNPAGLAFHGGNLYVTDTGDNTLSDVTQTVAVPFTLGGTADAGVAFSGATASLLSFGIGQTTQDITGRLLSDPGPNQTLTLTLGTPAGGALGSPSVNTLTINESATGTPTPTPTPTSTAPLFLGDQWVFSGKGKHKKLKGFEFLFNGALNAGSASRPAIIIWPRSRAKRPRFSGSRPRSTIRATSASPFRSPASAPPGRRKSPSRG